MEQGSSSADRCDQTVGLSRAQLEQLEKQLLHERERALQAISEFDERARTSGPEAAGDLSLFPVHPADEGSDAMEREVDFAVAMGTGELFSQIQEALRLICEEPERYATCRTCGCAIPFERLELIPWTQLCRACESTAAKRFP